MKQLTLFPRKPISGDWIIIGAGIIGILIAVAVIMYRGRETAPSVIPEITPTANPTGHPSVYPTYTAAPTNATLPSRTPTRNRTPSPTLAGGSATFTPTRTRTHTPIPTRTPPPSGVLGFTVPDVKVTVERGTCVHAMNVTSKGSTAFHLAPLPAGAAAYWEAASATVAPYGTKWVSVCGRVRTKSCSPETVTVPAGTFYDDSTGATTTFKVQVKVTCN